MKYIKLYEDIDWDWVDEEWFSLTEHIKKIIY